MKKKSFGLKGAFKEKVLELLNDRYEKKGYDILDYVEHRYEVEMIDKNGKRLSVPTLIFRSEFRDVASAELEKEMEHEMKKGNTIKKKNAGIDLFSEKMIEVLQIKYGDDIVDFSYDDKTGKITLLDINDQRIKTISKEEFAKIWKIVEDHWKKKNPDKVEEFEFELDRIELAEALYWWLADNHEGQGSDKYEALCRLEKIFKPSPSSSSSKLTGDVKLFYEHGLTDDNYDNLLEFLLQNDNQNLNLNPLRWLKGSRVQTVWIPRKNFSKAQAVKWIKENKFRANKVDVNDKWYKFRQESTKHFNEEHRYTKELKHGILLKGGEPEE